MRKSIFLIITICFSLLSVGQNKEPKEITPDLLQTIKTCVDKQVVKFKETLLKDEMTNEQIEFSVDTFRIEHIAAKKIDLDYSTTGMNKTVDELTDSYDILLNKYYKKLLNSLNEEDKKVLIAAQRAWLSFRDTEAKLIWTMTKDEYSGGGTMQSNIATGSYSYLVKQRTIDIFSYYNEITKRK